MDRPADPARKTPLSTVLVFAAGGLPISALGVAMAISVQPYFAQELGVGLLTIALAFAVVRILDVGFDIALAILMDRTGTPIGRYRPWLILGVPVLMLGVYKLFMAPHGVDLTYLIVWYLVYALGNSIVVLSRNAWSAGLVTRYDQRARFYGILTFLAVIGIMIILLTPVVASRFGHGLPNSVQLMGWIVLILIPPCAGLCALLVPERVTSDANLGRVALRDYLEIVRKPELLRLFVSSFSLTLGPGWMANLYLFYFIADRGFSEPQAYLLLACYIVAGVFGALGIGYIAGRFSKHRTMIVATVCYSIGLCTVLILPKGVFVVTVPVMLWCGFMATGFDQLTTAMMADLGDQIRLEQGKERMALLFAVTGLAGKLAGAGALGFSYVLLYLVGYDPTRSVHNTPAALMGLQWVFITGPIFFVTLGGLCFVGWKLDARRHGEIRTALEARDAQMAEPGLAVLPEAVGLATETGGA